MNKKYFFFSQKQQDIIHENLRNNGKIPRINYVILNDVKYVYTDMHSKEVSEAKFDDLVAVCSGLVHDIKSRNENGIMNVTVYLLDESYDGMVIPQ